VTATHKIRSNPYFHQPHIVALTANAFSEDRERCYLAGMDDFVSKPVSLNRLLDALLQAPAAVNGSQSVSCSQQ
jgi:CheY-like chemotaxis protein